MKASIRSCIKVLRIILLLVFTFPILLGSFLPVEAQTESIPAPGEFEKTTPIPGSVLTETSVVLSWGASENAASYSYCLDTNPDVGCNAEWVAVGTDLSVEITNLEHETTYFWQAQAINETGSTNANDDIFWDFLTPPATQIDEEQNPAPTEEPTQEPEVIPTEEPLPDETTESESEPDPNQQMGFWLDLNSNYVVAIFFPVGNYLDLYKEIDGVWVQLNQQSAHVDNYGETVFENVGTFEAYDKIKVEDTTGVNVVIGTLRDIKIKGYDLNSNSFFGTINSTDLNGNVLDSQMYVTTDAAGGMGTEIYADENGDWNYTFVLGSDWGQISRNIQPLDTLWATALNDGGGGTWISLTIPEQPPTQCYTLNLIQPDWVVGAEITANPLPNCNEGTQYQENTVVQLTATPVPDHGFYRWSGDLESEENPTSIVMDGNKTIGVELSQTPRIGIDYKQQVVLGYEFPGDITIELLINGVPIASRISMGGNLSVFFEGWEFGFTFYPTDKIELRSNQYSISMVGQSVSITNVDVETNVVSGTANVTPLSVRAHDFKNDTHIEWENVPVINGEWSVDFDDTEHLFDFKPGDIADASFNNTSIEDWGNSRDTFFVPLDPPILTYTGPNLDGWFKTDVTLTWECTDEFSGVMIPPEDVFVSIEGSAVEVKASCTNNHEVTSEDIRFVKLDKTPPIVEWVDNSISQGGKYYFGAVPPIPTCKATDVLSGIASQCQVSDYEDTVGIHTMTATATDFAGNVTTLAISYAVLPWNISGFYSPVNMDLVYNSIKGGSTVPLKFEVFMGDIEIIDPLKMKISLWNVPCLPAPEDPIEQQVYSTNELGLRYVDGKFVYNWKTPKTIGCYMVYATAQDGSNINALFKIK